MADLPTGTVTFLFTDIEGSTPLWEREPDQMRLALARHHAILRTTIANHGGHAYKTIGDAFQAAFALPAQAVAAALAAQRAFATQPWETSEPIHVRMGVHVGPAVAEDTDYRTTHTLNRVARITAAGHGGQILLSSEVADLVCRDVPTNVTLRDMGTHRMKGLTHLEHLFQLVVADLPATFPPLKTLDYHPNNLPLQPTLLIGREKEIASVCSLLRRADIRLVTLTGPGGTGKTRLALQTAAELIDEFSDGVWFVNLAPMSDPELVATTIAQIVMQERMERQASGLAETKGLRNRGRDQGRVTERRQRNKIDTVPECIEQLRSDLKPEAGFSDATRTREGQQAHRRAAQEGADRRHLLLAPDQRGRLHRQICGMGVECLERREDRRQIWRDQLKQVLQLGQTFHAMRAHVTKGDIGGQLAAHQIGHFP